MRIPRPAHIVFLALQVQELHSPAGLRRKLLAMSLMVFITTINCSPMLEVHHVLEQG